MLVTRHAPLEHRFDGTWDGWRIAAREALRLSHEPERVIWRTTDDGQESIFGALPQGASSPAAPSTVSTATVPRAFLGLGADVACHASPARWSALYRTLWRIMHGERHLLDVFVDDDVHALQQMAKAVRREGHKLRAFVRFRQVGADTPSERYVAWFEPEHRVLAREAPFFARRFPSMRWSILTPDACAHWDGTSLVFAPGVSRLLAPSGDDLEGLWRTYYAHTFNPARVKPKMMRSEMPVRYWKHLPEAQLIAPLMRDAPARVREMIERQRRLDAVPPEPRTARLASPPRSPSRTMPVHDAGIAEAAARSRRARAHLALRGIASGASPLAQRDVRIGTASWTDPTMTATGVFYPDGVRSAEARLAHYASQFSLVEVDSTYYAMPSERVSRLWAERTPAGFTFDVKAHALMTGHSTSTARLPLDIRNALPHELRNAREIAGSMLPAELLEEIWRRFLSALSPLRETGKLGALLLQLPRHLAASSDGERTIASLRSLAGDDVCCAVELRHASWVEGSARRERTLSLFREHDLVFVMVDAPPGFATSMPAMTAVTSDRLAVLRLHGRRREMWERAVDAVSERYRYLYDAAELGEWVPRIIDVAQRTQGVHVLMNNCHANYGTSNADEITALLVEADLERQRLSPPPGLLVD